MCGIPLPITHSSNFCLLETLNLLLLHQAPFPLEAQITSFPVPPSIRIFSDSVKVGEVRSMTSWPAPPVIFSIASIRALLSFPKKSFLREKRFLKLSFYLLSYQEFTLISVYDFCDAVEACACTFQQGFRDDECALNQKRSQISRPDV